MTAAEPTILATSTGFRPGTFGLLDMRPGPIHYFAAELAMAGDAPRICVLNQATGDPEGRIGATYAAFAKTSFRVSHLQLFPLPNVEDIRGHLLAQDVIWVGGGSVANLVAVWRVHGLDEILYEAWQSGVVLAASQPGRSAGTSAAQRTASGSSCAGSPTGWAGCRTAMGCITTVRNSGGR